VSLARVRRVAIIGGGPAGAHCARRLAEHGVDVTLFEPRTDYEKACGGGIPIRGMDRFPFLHDAALPGKAIHRCHVIAPSGREARFPLLDPLFIFRRSDLHRLLLGRAADAGARVVRDRVVSFRRAADAGGGPGGGWILRCAGDGEADAEGGPYDFLVAADGAAGSARRRLAGAARPEDVSQGIGYYLPGLSEEVITLKFYHRLHGYLWVFPRPDHSSAGICATLGALPAAGLKQLMDEFLRQRYGADLLERSGRYAALIPGAPLEPASDPVQGEGWAFVGDAGRFVDPLTREGIYYAMLSGELLADTLASGRPERYAEAWSRHCARELSWAAKHGANFFAPRSIEWLVALCDLSPAVARVMSDVMAGRQGYRSLGRRLLLKAPVVAFQVATRALTPARGN
jgi:geranylgeranyl diphosphate/geranylgeranyl-bacteriochlorophyllide a reductase